MADQSDYTAAANAMLPVIQSDLNMLVPAWARGMIPHGAASALAGQLSKAAVDAIDAHRSRTS